MTRTFTPGGARRAAPATALLSLVGLSVAAFSGSASAGVVLTSGDTRIGIDDRGELVARDSSGTPVGLERLGIGDAITPGCECEGWGVSADDEVGYVGGNGNRNIDLVSFDTDGTSFATSTVLLRSLPSFTVTQTYAASAAEGVFVDRVTLANGGATDIGEVRYTRSMDWDIPPDAFNEFVTIDRGNSAALIYSSDDGFGTPNPLVEPGFIVAGTENADFVDSGPEDHGAFFTFSFGALAAGESREFDIFFGSTASETDAFAALATVGAEVYSFGQQSGDPETGTPATFLFAFAGVGGDVVGEVPEPGSLALLGAGALGLFGGGARRRRRRATAV